MKYGRYLFTAACALLQAAAPVFSAEEPVLVASAFEEQVRASLRGVVSAVVGADVPDATGADFPVASPGASKTLTVYVDKATNLEGEDTVGSSDVYVELEVWRDNWTVNDYYGKDETTVKDLPESKTVVWGETFTYLIPGDLENVKLTLTVYDEDVDFDDKMGDTTIKLEDQGLTATPKEVAKSIDDHTFSEDEMIYVKLSYA